MKLSMRKLAAITLSAVALAILFLLFLGGEAGDKAASGLSWVSSEQCGSCHAAQFEQWKKDLHSQAWTDPEPRKLSNNFANTDCISCHAPRPVFETGVGQRVLPRISRRIEGVDCLSCHAAAEGVAATRAGLKAVCNPVLKPELKLPVFCSGCHNQHGTVDQWQKTEYAKKGIGCVECHMKGSHQMPVKSDAKSIASALTWDFRVEGRKAALRIANTGAGHDFPTDSKHKAVDLKYRILQGAAENAEWTRLARFRDPYRDDQIDLERTTIPAGEERNFSVDLPEGSGRVELLLLYKWTPFTEDKDAVVVFRETREFGK